MAGLRRPGRRLVGVAALATAAGLALAGCGSQPTAGEAAPAVRAALTSLDDAVADERYRRARAALRDLVEATIKARRAGQLTPEQADRILAAAARVDASMPKPPPQPVVEETEEPAEDFDEYDDEGGEDHKEEKEEKEGKKDKEDEDKDDD